MSGIYKVPFSYTGNTAVDLAEVVAHATKPLMLVGFNIFQTSDAGDAAEETVELTFVTGNTSAGTGGSSVTPVNTVTTGPAAGFTAAHQNTTAATGGTGTERGRWGWNVRIGYDKIFTEVEQILMAAALRGVFKIAAAADSLTIKGELLLQEIT